MKKTAILLGAVALLLATSCRGRRASDPLPEGGDTIRVEIPMVNCPETETGSEAAQSGAEGAQSAQPEASAKADATTGATSQEGAGR